MEVRALVVSADREAADRRVEGPVVDLPAGLDDLAWWQPILPREAVHVILVDRCIGCRGVWFDEGEMNEAIRSMKLRTAPEPPAAVVPRQSGAIGQCPRCGAGMETLQSRSAPQVEYDRCPRCGGVWFDPGEAETFGDEHVGLLALMLDEFG